MRKITHSAIFVSCYSAYKSWVAKTASVENSQQRLLFSILNKNRNTVFGKKFGFEKIQSIKHFQDQVFPQVYEDLESYIKRMLSGEIEVLTGERVLLFEPTSGSVSACKYIPYTKGLRQEFQAGIKPWLYLLYRDYPSIRSGVHYWSISPRVTRGLTQGGIPIGFEKDTEYLGLLSRVFLDRVMALPGEVTHVPHIENFRYLTLLFLLSHKDLTFISLWNPTFLKILLEALVDFRESFIEDIKSGSLNPPVKLSKTLKDYFLWKLNFCRRRSVEVVSLLRENQDPYSLAGALWPKLSLISCWSDANAKDQAIKLQRKFPYTPFQPKGLISTESFATFPYPGLEGGVLSLGSHFFEFEKNGKYFLAHEISLGETYSLVVTTSGGLYRYQTKDQVKITGFHNQCPSMVFVGKEDSIVDLVGEKLSEGFLVKVMDEFLNKYSIEPEFWMVSPNPIGNGYCLFIKSTEILPVNLALEIDIKLRGSFHYSYARTLGQLEEFKVVALDNNINPSKLYLETCTKLGQKLGDIKPRRLHQSNVWYKVFSAT